MGWRYSAGSRHQLASVQQLEVKPVAGDSHIQAQDPPQSTPTDHCEANHIRNWRSGSAGLFGAAAPCRGIAPPRAALTPTPEQA